MPLYICSTKAGAIDADAKAAIASAITTIHCAVTDAPEKFVHTAFFEDEARFPLGELTVGVFGNIRAGRTPEQKQQIVDAIQDALAKHAGVEQAASQVFIGDTPASWVMEGGHIMPEPGEEAEWLAAHDQQG